MYGVLARDLPHFHTAQSPLSDCTSWVAAKRKDGTTMLNKPGIKKVPKLVQAKIMEYFKRSGTPN